MSDNLRIDAGHGGWRAEGKEQEGTVARSFKRVRRNKF